jgi:hypothetical protein
MKFNAIIKICKYRGLHEGHHFILMAMELHGAPKPYMDRFIKEGVCLFHDRQSRGHLSFFCIQFFRQCVSITFQCVNIVFQHALTSAIENKIVFTSDVYPRPPIIIKSQDLHASDIREVMGEIVSYHERD